MFIHEKVIIRIPYSVSSSHCCIRIVSSLLSVPGTGDSATDLADKASNEGLLEKYFVTQGKEGEMGAAQKRFSDRVKKSRSREVGIHFENGLVQELCILQSRWCG